MGRTGGFAGCKAAVNVVGRRIVTFLLRSDDREDGEREEVVNGENFVRVIWDGSEGWDRRMEV